MEKNPVLSVKLTHELMTWIKKIAIRRAQLTNQITPISVVIREILEEAKNSYPANSRHDSK